MTSQAYPVFQHEGEILLLRKEVDVVNSRLIE